MSELTGPSAPRHPEADELVELALGQAPAADALSAHLGGCGDCRAAYDDVTRDLEAALAATPAIEPPAGFESRLLGRLAEQPTPLLRRRRRRLAMLAAAAAVGLIAGVGGALGLTNALDDDPDAGTAGYQAGSVALRKDDGTVVGRVLPSRFGDEEVLVLRIDDAPPGMRYTCRLRLEDDSTAAAGDWVIPDSGTATWITTGGPDVEAVELVTDTGKVWSSASLD